MTYPIKTVNLSYSIKSKKILENINIVLRNHDFVGLIGPNGSGKTTFIKHLYNEIESKNKIWINQKSLDGYKQKDLAKSLTVLKQENISDFDFNVLQIVLMGRAPYRESYEPYNLEDQDLAKKFLKIVGMYDKKMQSFSTLSGGEKQRVLIARALTQDVDILLLDEPTNHLDIYHQISLMEMLSSLDKTVLSVFHDLNLAAKFCDYIYVLFEGEVIAEGNPTDIITTEMLSDIFNVKADIIDNRGKPYIVYQNALGT